MSVSATEAKNRFGQLLEQAQRAPVVIEKAGRRHSVLLSVEQYELLLSAQRHAAQGLPGRPTAPRPRPSTRSTRTGWTSSTRISRNTACSAKSTGSGRPWPPSTCTRTPIRANGPVFHTSS